MSSLFHTERPVCFVLGVGGFGPKERCKMKREETEESVSQTHCESPHKPNQTPRRQAQGLKCTQIACRKYKNALKSRDKGPEEAALERSIVKQIYTGVTSVTLKGLIQQQPEQMLYIWIWRLTATHQGVSRLVALSLICSPLLRGTMQQMQYVRILVFWLSFFPSSFFHALFCINNVVIYCQVHWNNSYARRYTKIK